MPLAFAYSNNVTGTECLEINKPDNMKIVKDK